MVIYNFLVLSKTVVKFTNGCDYTLILHAGDDIIRREVNVWFNISV